MTKIISLTQGKVTLVSDQDFEKLNKYKWCFDGQYAQRRIRTKTLRMHRDIFDVPKGMQVDHIDGDHLNNTRENLRICTNAENQMNRSKKGMYKGVTLHKETGKFRAYIKKDGKQIHLGLFEKPEDAAKEYDRAAVELFGSFARTNL